MARGCHVTQLSKLAAAAFAVVLFVTVPSSAAPPTPTPAVAIAGPEAATAGFLSRVVVAVQGQALTFVNADLALHTLTSKQTRPKRVKYGRRWYVIQIPIFDSSGVAPAASQDVKGVTSLKPGSYDFYCSLHTGMTGTLVVVSAG